MSAIEFIILQTGLYVGTRMPLPAVEFKVAPRIVVASLERKGPYAGVAEAMRDLKSWIGSKGVKQAEYPFCLYYDDPTEMAESELRSEVCIPIARVLDGEGGSE